MGKYKRKTKRTWTEENMEEAIRAVRNGMSMLKASRIYNVPYTCIHRRGPLKMSTNFIRKQGGQTVFSKVQEEELKERIIKLSRCGFGLSPKDIRCVAYAFAEDNNIKHNFSKSNKMAGKDFLKGYLSRHMELSPRTPQGLSHARSEGLNKEEVADYFRLLDEVLQKTGLMNKPGCLYNQDETGCPMNNKPSNKVITLKGSKHVVSHTCVERGENVTVAVCTNAIGQYIPPFVIMKGKRFHNEYQDGFPNGTKVVMSDSGWMNEETFLQWLFHFEEFRVPGPCVLILDGHVSHRSLGALKFCEEKSIHLICLPSHTTHRLQPLDRSFFKPLKSYYNEACNNFIHRSAGERKINKLNFGLLFKSAWSKAATPSNAESGFASCGIYPFNPNVIKEDEYLPSLPARSMSPSPVVQNSENSSTPSTPTSNNHNPSPSTSFHELLPTPTKGKTSAKSRKGKSKQKACLLTSPENITQMENKITKGANQSTNANQVAEKVSGKKKKAFIKRLQMESDSDSFEECVDEDGQKHEKNKNNKDDVCQFCNLNYSDPKSVKKGAWIQCQVKGEWYHEVCVGAERKKHSYVVNVCRYF